jgi:hypothetical protein
MKTTVDLRKERLGAGQKVGVVNLGCARNLVDAQMLLGRLKKNGHRIVDANEAQTVIVNTCSFIEEWGFAVFKALFLPGKTRYGHLRLRKGEVACLEAK